MGELSREQVERFHSSYEVVTESGCWIWMKHTHLGYGYFNADNKHYRAHRWIYQHLIGPIPGHLQCDHLCRVRCCVNPYHIRITSNRVNSLASNSPAALNFQKTHCNKGHAFTPENTGNSIRGWRVCLICNRARCREQYERNEKCRKT